jgi:hypothetical protein
MDVDRKIVKRLTANEDIDDGYVQADMSELISMMWEITSDVWTFIREKDVKQRLQRNIAVVIGRTS